MDGSLDRLTNGYAGRMEVLEGRSDQRLRSEAERARIAAKNLVSGVKVADVTRRHGATRWQVYTWRRKLRSGALAVRAETAEEVMSAALVVEHPDPSPPKPRKDHSETRPRRIELVVDGIFLREGSDVDEDYLTRMIRAIRAASQ